ncbi:DUF2147 domain-containing protein [Pseudofulvibacter geojedonensis]|uniref:DUF2147 domain-containing protein n=1 Tax=Pseudofulvibacter geojedonensis TaxID=1123758 RepID=UPI0036729440
MIFLLFIFCGQPSSENYLGRWKLLGGSVVEIYKNNGIYEGKIIKRSNFPIYNRNGLDNKNPNKDLRNQPIVGLVILKNMCYKDGVLSGGTLYNSDKGETYQVKLEIYQDNINECWVEVFDKEKNKKFKIHRLVN